MRQLDEGVFGKLNALLYSTWRAVAARPDQVTGRRIAIPPTVPAEPGAVESRFANDFPVLSLLPETVALARGYELGDLADGFLEIEDMLSWSQNPAYTPETCDESLLNGYAYAALSGPEGPVYCAAPRGGFMLMAPNVLYPDHSHGPREIYLVLTPGTQWRLDGGDWFDVEPGALIYHDAWQTHSMRTTRHPLLCFAGWIEPGDRLAIGWSEKRSA